jgi:hypothetical protein
MVQPPSAGAAVGPLDIIHATVDEQRDNRAAALHGLTKRGIVGQPKVSAKPDDGGTHADLCS